MRSVKRYLDLLQTCIDQYNHRRQVRAQAGIKQVVMKLMLVAQLYHKYNHSKLPHRR